MKSFKGFFIAHPNCGALEGIRNIQEWRSEFRNPMISGEKSPNLVSGALIIQGTGICQNYIVIDRVKVLYKDSFTFVNHRCNNFHFLFNERGEENKDTLQYSHWLWQTNAVADIEEDKTREFLSSLDEVKTESGNYCLEHLLFPASTSISFPSSLRVDNEGAAFVKRLCDQHGFFVALDRCKEEIAKAIDSMSFKMKLRKRNPAPIKLYKGNNFLTSNLTLEESKLVFSDDLCRVELASVTEDLTKKLVSSFEEL